jgi:NAD(P)-dependent dehydrogenase (short-subunit alcohol dehydrogenase family)
MAIKLKPIRDQVVVLLGASSGIGREAAVRFARGGARVVVSARDEVALQGVLADIRAAGGRGIAIATEASDPDQVQALADRVVGQCGRIDTWVQLAGVGLWAPFEETTPDEWKRVIDVNLNGTAYAAMAALPHLRKQGGSLILVSSTEGFVGMPYQSAYAASKHAIHGLVKVLRLELGKAGAPVNLTEILPSGINTPLFDKARTKIGTLPMPPPPLYEPSIAADAILFAAENVVPEIVVGGTGLAFSALRRVSHGLADALLLVGGFRLQHSWKPKPETAPDNLTEHLPGHDQVNGSLEAVTRGTSVTTWLQTHPVARRAAGAALAGTAAVLLFRALRNTGDRPT